MKTYQLIYTSVQHSLSDSSLGLSNQSGLRVYSCSQGVTEENIREIRKLSSYRLPKNNEVTFSEIIGDPKIPDMFPKAFRTLRLSDGRFAAIQTVFSGVDFQGEPDNFFAHALIFDDIDEGFFPEQYINNGVFKKYLTAQEAECELVHYLPPLDVMPDEDTKKHIEEFISSHKKELSYLIEKALSALVSDKTESICIASADADKTADYLISHKWLLPRDISVNSGISTYNVYLPSGKQPQIVFYGTIKGKNNITKQAVETRENCIYTDMDKKDFSQTELSPVFDFTVEDLRKEYTEYKFNSVTQFTDWLETLKNVSAPGMGAKLLRFKASAGDKAFAKRVSELYAHINDENMKPVRFEILKAAFDSISLFPDIEDEVSEEYVGQCVDKLCGGGNYDVYDLFSNGGGNIGGAHRLKAHIGEYIEKIKPRLVEMVEKNKRILINLFADIKHRTETETWKELFGADREKLGVFVELASVMITGYGLGAFTAPSEWTDEDLAETAAYFEASAEDEKIKDSCIKYICEHEDINWEKYGITITERVKTKDEQETDIRKIRRMLAKVGYIPYKRNTYDALKSDVRRDMNQNRSPLMLSKLLDAYYSWKTDGENQAQAQKDAQKIAKLLLEMRRKEKTCYDFIIPKLALEIVETDSNYHELIVNAETMPESFWNWFIIGYKRNEGNDITALNYIRIYEASKRRFLRIPAGKPLRETFSKTEGV